MIGEIVITILAWLFVVVVIVRVRLDPRRLRAEAEAMRTYGLQMTGRDLDPVVLARRNRTRWIAGLVAITVVMIALVLAMASGALTDSAASG